MCFDRAELDKVLANGDHKRGRGRPRKGQYSTYTQDIEISSSKSSRATVQVPDNSAGKTFHVICEVTDNGTHNLTSYRRVIFKPIGKDR